jgi:hypothetical protein
VLIRKGLPIMVAAERSCRFLPLEWSSCGVVSGLELYGSAVLVRKPKNQ